MKNPALKKLDRLLRLSFYALFLLTPWLMYSKTSELFELNKMWFVFCMSLVIFFLWSAKMITRKRFFIRRTPLDIPIVLFLVSQTISTIFSLDSYVSFWGYYSRFNGGLLSLLCYVFLYYAFVSNITPMATEDGDEKISGQQIAAFFAALAVSIGGTMLGGLITSDFGKFFYLTCTALLSLFLFVYATPKNPLKKILTLIFSSGLVVALWGLPSHFGYDPTCFLFRGSLDVECWTNAFQPKLRIFSTLGQPNWLAAYLAVLIPLAVAFSIYFLKNRQEEKGGILRSLSPMSVFFTLSALLFYVDLVWTKSQSGFVGFWIGMAGFAVLLLYISARQKGESILSKQNIKNAFGEKSTKIVLASMVVLLFTNFIIGFPIQRLSKFTYKEIFSSQRAARASNNTAPSLEPLGGTDSGKIRLIVWSGALKIFGQNPIFGTGVETFAFAYYKVKPIAHNLTSEWDYLYNKAHNEYLNYLTTTGLFGLLTYLSMIALFFYSAGKIIIKRGKSMSSYYPVALALIGSYVTILVSNFFGFSVVVINLFLFLIPGLFFHLEKQQDLSMFELEDTQKGYAKIGAGQIVLSSVIGIVVLVCIVVLARYWIADTDYALGNNLDHVSEYPQAYQSLVSAVQLRPHEPVFKDELSVNLSTLALLLNSQKESTQAAILASEAIQLSDDVTTNHPNNVVFFKSRTRVFYALSEIDPRYLDNAIATISKAHTLAPTDAKITYNEALLYQQKGDISKTIDLLKQTAQLKPNYEDAYYALALNYIQLAKSVQKQDPQKAAEYNTDAKNTLTFIITRLDPKNQKTKELLNSLEK